MIAILSVETMGKPDVSTADIDALKAKPTKERSKATKLTNELKHLFSEVRKDGQSNEKYELEYTVGLGEEHLAKMEQLAQQLQDLGVEDDTQHLTDLHRAIGLGKLLLRDAQKEAETPATQNMTHQASQSPQGFKMKFTLPRFSGDLLAWPDFWELFEASVHKNGAYSHVQKLHYLKQHLDGVASHAIQGLQLTLDNYLIAVQTLKDRFGKDDQRKKTIISRLLNLPATTNVVNLMALRRLVDDITAGVNSLNSVGVEHAGDVLLPVLESKIPPPWRLEWVKCRDKSTSSEQDEFTRFVLFLQKEVEYLEEATQVPCSKVSDDTSHPSHRSTTSVLHSQRVGREQNSTKTCFVCRAEHHLGRCDRYLQLSVDDRWTTAKRVGACYRCLGRHRAKDCRSGSCHICHGSHHTSLHRPQLTSTSIPIPPANTGPHLPVGQPSAPPVGQPSAPPVLQ